MATAETKCPHCGHPHICHMLHDGNGEVSVDPVLLDRAMDVFIGTYRIVSPQATLPHLLSQIGQRAPGLDVGKVTTMTQALVILAELD